MSLENGAAWEAFDDVTMANTNSEVFSGLREAKRKATFHQRHTKVLTERAFGVAQGCGNRLIELAEPIWATQQQGIENSKWFK